MIYADSTFFVGFEDQINLASAAGLQTLDLSPKS